MKSEGRDLPGPGEWLGGKSYWSEWERPAEAIISLQVPSGIAAQYGHNSESEPFNLLTHNLADQSHLGIQEKRFYHSYAYNLTNNCQR
jgi:hypothetical protein